MKNKKIILTLSVIFSLSLISGCDVLEQLMSSNGSNGGNSGSMTQEQLEQWASENGYVKPQEGGAILAALPDPWLSTNEFKTANCSITLNPDQYANNSKPMIDYLNRSDSIYIDLRDAYEGYNVGHVSGFEPISWFRLLCGDNNQLFYVDENKVYHPRYEESEYLLKKIFPENKNIFIMCQSGGRVMLCLNLLSQYGYDMNKCYNIGGFNSISGNENTLGYTIISSVKAEQTNYNFDDLTIIKPILDTNWELGESKIIYVGNTAPSTGAFAAVGVPFNAGLEAALDAYNKAGGFGDAGLQVKLKHYDDGFDAETGLNYTKKLVEEDKVFALVGHFGTPTVDSTIEYIKDQRVPMVYAASPISSLYYEKATGNEKNLMSVQPIYETEGRALLARAMAKSTNNLGLGGSKIGVIYTDDSFGKGILAGIKRQIEESPSQVTDNIRFVSTDSTAGANHTNAVTALKNAECDVVIVGSNLAQFIEIMEYFITVNYDNVKVITSYVSANSVLAYDFYMKGIITDTRQIYTTSWLDITDTSYCYAPDSTNIVGTALWDEYRNLIPNIYDNGVSGFSKEYWETAETIYGYCLESDNLKDSAFLMSYNSYALVGYIAGWIFVEGLKRLETSGQELTRENYIAAIESSSIDFPIGGEVDFSNGSRIGTTSFGLNKFVYNELTYGELQVYSPILSLKEIYNSMN